MLFSGPVNKGDYPENSLDKIRLIKGFSPKIRALCFVLMRSFKPFMCLDLVLTGLKAPTN